MAIPPVAFVRRVGVLVLVVVVAALGLIGCGGAEDTAAPRPSPIPDTNSIVSAVVKDPALAAALPPQVAGSGSLRLATNLQSPPNNFYAADGRTPIGYEVDIAKAIAAKLGVRVEHQDADFSSLIPSLESGRVDLTMAAMNDTKEREARIDFVDYFTSGITIMVRKANPEQITEPDALCGKAVAAVQGTSNQRFAAEQSTECARAGKPAVTIEATDSDARSEDELKTGRVSAVLNDLPSASFAARTVADGAAFDVVPGQPLNGGPYGIGFAKSNRQLADAVRGALQALIDDGTYDRILTAWGLQQGALRKAAFNGAP
ncbi:ABC transporter substrate-binding protein [Amycolatopsis minnesotensis]|uniref:ABC transporter substrate-binding protein n=1 Tax=Amycolatopsis minnesotensis TaxID=337894 RepID=A0ABN2QPX1_9PSEU